VVVDCPFCGRDIVLVNLAPGRYRPACPSCLHVLVIVVPGDRREKIEVRSVASHPTRRPAFYPQPAPSRTPRRAALPARRVTAAAGATTPRLDPPVRDTDFIDVDDDGGSATLVADPPAGPSAGTLHSVGEPTDDPLALQFSVESDAVAPAEETEADAADYPEKLGGYEVIKVLGKGGMGAVLLGRQVSLDRKVALKVMHARIADDPVHVARFTREAYAAAQLTHHNVVQIYDIGEDKGQHFFSMEFVAGQSLMDVVKAQGKVAPEVAVGYALQAARGLRYGHVQGMVHRDIKPANLMLNTEGIVKVADLGLVKLGPEVGDTAAATSPRGGAEMTQAGRAMGTPAYMAPEQAQDSSAVDARADIYSLGCTLYVLLTGKPPFLGRSVPEVISKHLTEPVVPPDVLVKRVPKALSHILLTMLAKDPAARYQSMDGVIAALEGFLGLDQRGSFEPTEEQADKLEGYAKAFNAASRDGLKRLLALLFVVGCVAGVVGTAFGKKPVLAGGILGLLAVAPVAYFVAHGLLTGGVVFSKVREAVFGMRVFDWLMGVGGAGLFVVTLFLFGLLGVWLAFAAAAVVLALAVWAVADKAQAAGRQPPLDAARAQFKTMRFQGIGEEALRQFACQFSGPDWEPLFEALFGYEAKLAARAYRKGNTGEPARTHAAWREPVIAYFDARVEARRQARERKHLQHVEAKALEAEGVGKADARDRAGAMAADLVDQAAAAHKARREGREASVRGMVAAARDRRPPAGYNLAGVKLRKLRLKHALDEWLGRKLRFSLGAALFAAGLLWMHQNHLLTAANPVVQKVLAGEVVPAALAGFGAPAVGEPLRLAVLPGKLAALVHSYRVPLVGLLLILSALLYHGWKPSTVGVAGAVVGVVGPALGVPDAGPAPAPLVSVLAAGLLIVVAGRYVRR